MTYFRIFSAVSPDTGSDWYDETGNCKIMVDDVARLVNIGSEFSVWVYSDRHAFLNGADPYAVLTYGGGDCITVSDTIGGWSDRRSARMHVVSPTPAIISERVNARVHTLAKRYCSVY